MSVTIACTCKLSPVIIRLQMTDAISDDSRNSSDSDTLNNRSAVEPFVIAIIIFSALSLWVGKLSDGFLEADACTHYQYARWCWQEPSYLINVWGRPFCTAIYAVPALLADRAGTKIACLLIALITAVLTWRIAIWQKYRWPALAGIFVLAQPLVFLHSFSTLTELPFAMLLAAAFLMYCQKRWWAVALLAGLLPLARPEGFAFLVLAAIVLIAHRRPYWVALLIVPLLVWSVIANHIEPDPNGWWRWIPDHWPYAEKSLYASGSIWHFIGLLPVIASPLLLPFLLIGFWQDLPYFRQHWLHDHKLRCDLLIALIPLAILAGHSWLYYRGAMASSGEVRYMLIVAPFWALLTERGWDWCLGRFKSPHPYLLAGIASLLPISVNFIYPVLPLHFDANWQHARRITQWYEQSGIAQQYPKIVSAHPGILYFLHTSPNDPDHSVPWNRQSIANDPPGTVLIWDDIYSLYNADNNLVIRRSQIEKAGWILYRVETEGAPPYSHTWAIYLSRTSK
ncbi:MAG TPA: hypothetical protein VGG19_08520 [Tepidisphaeraceae bacterium]